MVWGISDVKYLVGTEIRQTKAVDPKTFKRFATFITRLIGDGLIARHPGSANTEYDIIKTKISYCQEYKRQ